MYISDTSRKFQIVWDLGRRCTYACTYCPPHRNNKTSRLITFAEMKETLEFIDEYFEFMQDFRFAEQRLFPSLSFTGGEPTIHPDFFKFCKYVKDTYGDKYRVNLTTNGAFAKKILNNIDQYCDGGTISYHPEGGSKDLVREAIYKLGKGGRMGINVMFHKDYFDECVELCNDLDNRGIKYKARRIGDDGNDKSSILMGYTHLYTEEQERIFDQYAGIKNSKKGRGCCGGRCLKIQNKEGLEHEGWFLPSTNFEGWSCGINWYFLYINQETRDIFTHQTCQVNLDGEIGPIGHLDNTDALMDRLTEQFYEKRQFPVIKCPKKFCGCGMCIDKSNDFNKYVEIQKDKIHSVDFLETEQVPWEHPAGNKNTVRAKVEAMDGKG